MSDVDILSIGARFVEDSDDDVRVFFTLRDGTVAHVTMTVEELIERAWTDPEVGECPGRLVNLH
jgi:hypothetical protein